MINSASINFLCVCVVFWSIVLVRKMPNRCVAANCGNFPDIDRGICLHLIPFYENDNPVARKRRRQWVEFVKAKRANFFPTSASRLCSAHFKPEDFIRRFHVLEGQGKSSMPRLIRDEVGVIPVPTIQTKPPTEGDGGQGNTGLSSGEKRHQRQLVKDALEQSSALPVTLPVVDSEEVGLPDLPEEDSPPIGIPETGKFVSEEESREGLLHDNVLFAEMSTQTSECCGCVSLKEANRKMNNTLISLRASLTSQRSKAKAIAISKRRKLYVDEQMMEEEPLCVQECKYVEGGADESDDEFDDSDESYAPEEGMEVDSDSDSERETEIENQSLTTGDSDRDAPKHIVFLSQLLLLFKICILCKADNPLIITRQKGSMVVVKATCSNLSCGHENIWSSQPYWKNTKIPSGNLLLSMAILFAGSSISKVSTIFKHMGLGCMSLSTFFKIQRTKLFPTVHLFWKSYQKALFNKMREQKSAIVMSGDGRHDSMGHSAKYGAYTMFCNTTASVVHFEMVQKNEAGSSSGMELLGFRKSMQYLTDSQLDISTFISDRHTSIAKCMRENYNGITHYYDLWHLAKKIRKLLLKLAKEKHCEIVNDWIKSCVNHLYWSATTTSSGNGSLILAKFNVFLSHVLDKHEHLDNPLFDKCAHGPIETEQKYLLEDSIVYEKLHKALTNTRLLNAIKKVSPLDQTSSLEGLHSVVNQFAPKMFAFSHTGMTCRQILACTHYNYNLQREEECRLLDGAKKIKVVWPKFLNGEAKIRDVRVKQNYDYVEEMYKLLMSLTLGELAQEAEHLKNITPTPMNTMLERQPREEAILKAQSRKSMVVVDIPATGKDSEKDATKKKKKQRVAPKCIKCKVARKGHVCPFKGT